MPCVLGIVLPSTIRIGKGGTGVQLPGGDHASTHHRVCYLEIDGAVCLVCLQPSIPPL